MHFKIMRLNWLTIQIHDVAALSLIRLSQPHSHTALDKIEKKFINHKCTSNLYANPCKESLTLGARLLEWFQHLL